MLHYRAAVASRQVYGLAEGPVWDAPRRRVLWVDINAGKVHMGALVSDAHRGDQIEPTTEITFPETVGAVACSRSGVLLVAGARTLHTVDSDGTSTAGPQLVPADRPSRLNDGACDPAGRFLVGSMDLAGGRRGGESLYRIETSGEVTVIDGDLTLSNGLAWSPDGSSFYSIDTVPGVLFARSYEPDTGAFGTREVLLDMSDSSPDGMCVDSEGNLWIAIWGGCEVCCFSPTGQQIAVVEVAAPQVTSVAFVGPDLDILLITTAAEQLSADQLARYPDSGRLFTCRVGVTGTPVAPWAGASR